MGAHKVVFFNDVQSRLGRWAILSIRQAVDRLRGVIIDIMDAEQKSNDGMIHPSLQTDYLGAVRHLTEAFFTPIMHVNDEQTLRMASRFFLQCCLTMLNRISVRHDVMNEKKVNYLAHITTQVASSLQLYPIHDILSFEHALVMDGFLVHLSPEELVDGEFRLCTDWLVEFRQMHPHILEGFADEVKSAIGIRLQHLFRRVLAKDKTVFSQDAFLSRLANRFHETFIFCFDDLMTSNDVDTVRVFILTHRYLESLSVALQASLPKDTADQVKKKVMDYTMMSPVPMAGNA